MGNWWWLYMGDLIFLQSNKLEYNYIFESLKERIMYPCWKVTKWSILVLKITKYHQQKQSIMLLRKGKWKRRIRLISCCIIIITKSRFHITANPVMLPEKLCCFFLNFHNFSIRSATSSSLILVWPHSELILQSKLPRNCSPIAVLHFYPILCIQEVLSQLKSLFSEYGGE